MTKASPYENLPKDQCACHRACATSGSVEAIWFQNDPNWLVAFLACARVGGNAIALNKRFRQAELNDVFERLAPRVIFYQQSFRHMDFSGVVDGACRAGGLKNILEIFDTAPVAGMRLTVQDLIDRTVTVRETSSTVGDELILFTT